MELTIKELLESQSEQESFPGEEIREEVQSTDLEVQDKSAHLEQQEKQILENERYLSKLQELINEESQKLNTVEERIKELEAEAESAEIQAQTSITNNIRIGEIEELENKEYQEELDQLSPFKGV